MLLSPVFLSFRKEGRVVKIALHLNLKRIVLCLMALLLLCTAALAEESQSVPVTAVLTVTPETLNGPGTVSAAIRVTNVSGVDMTEPATLYDPQGKAVAGFGDGGSVLLKVEESQSVTVNYDVTAEELEKGEISFTLRCGGVSVPVNAAIESVAKAGILQVSRTFTPEIAREGATVSIVYELLNAGTSELTDIKVTDKLAKSAQSVGKLEPGDKKTLTVTAKMGKKDLVSSGKVTYKVSGEKDTKTVEIDEMTIPVAVKGLKVTLSSDRDSANIGETVVLTMTVENNGNISYSSVSVTDEKLGTVFEDLTIPAGASFVKQKEVTILEPTKFLFKLQMEDNTGMSNSLSTNACPVSAYDPEKELRLTLLLTAEKEAVETLPADLSMTLLVTNSSNVDCTNIKIKHGATAIYTIPSLKAGESTTLRRDFTISTSGQFRFTASAQDTIGNTVSFDSNTVSVAFLMPTPTPTKVPEVTPAPLVTVAPATYNDVDSSLRTARNVLYTAAFVFAGLFAAALLLYIIASIVRAGKRRTSEQAYDHLELPTRRDFTEPAKEKKTVIIETPEEPEETKPAEDDEPMLDIPDPLPEDALLKPAETAKPASESDGMGGFRVRREGTIEPAKELSDKSETAQPELKKRHAVKLDKDSEEDV